MTLATVYLVGPPVLHPAEIKYLLQGVLIDHLGHGFRDLQYAICVVLSHSRAHGSLKVEFVMRKDAQGCSV